MTLAYDGTQYHGFQKQQGSGLKTIQETLEQALFVLTQETIVVHGSGRTDAGVHAEGQVISFQSQIRVPAQRLPLAINSVLPRDIRVLECVDVEQDFHARFTAKRKTYCYKLYNERHMSPFWRYYAYHIPVPLDLEKMKQGADYFRGTHDFSGFCAKDTKVRNFVRTIYDCEIDTEGSIVSFRITGDGFLWNMVRIMMGTLLTIGKGKRLPQDIPKLLVAGERKYVGATVPPHGLYLVSVEY